MARHLLSARQVQTAGVGDHQDGDGLTLRVQPATSDKRLRASWVLRYTSPTGKRRELGLGGGDRSSIEAAGVSLKRARKKADEARDLLDKHLDPIDAKRARKSAERDKAAAERSAKKSEATTLRRYARAYHEQHVEPLRPDRFGQEWLRSIERHVPPALLDTPVAALTATDLLDALVPIMRKVPETGGKVYQRIARILDAAVIDGVRPDNPTAPIKRELRKRAGRREYSSHASMPYRRIPAFIAELRKQQGNAARCRSSRS